MPMNPFNIDVDVVVDEIYLLLNFSMHPLNLVHFLRAYGKSTWGMFLPCGCSLGACV